MRTILFLALGLLAGCNGPDIDANDVCDDGVQSCDCQGQCTWDNSIHECIDGEWESVIQCSGTQNCVEDEAGQPACQ